MPSLAANIRSLLNKGPRRFPQINDAFPNTSTRKIENELVELINKKQVAMSSDGKYLRT